MNDPTLITVRRNSRRDGRRRQAVSLVLRYAVEGVYALNDQNTALADLIADLQSAGWDVSVTDADYNRLAVSADTLEGRVGERARTYRPV